MACVALTSLMATIELEFLQPTQRVSLHDHAPIKSFFENLSSLQAFLQKESSGDDDDGGALRELEIQIRDFALRAEDDIEIQLSNILLAEDGEYREKASHKLYQSLREAAKTATELLKILAREKESCVSETEMAIAALTTLMTTFEYYFLHPLPTVSLDDEAAMISFFHNFSSLQASLQKESGDDGGAAIKKGETKIRNFALKAEGDIEMQVSNFLLAKDTEHEEEASQELRQTMQDAAKNAAELLKIFNKEIDHERVRKMTCVALTSLIATIKIQFLQPTQWKWVSCCHQEEIQSLLRNLCSLQAFLQNESSGDGGALKDLEIQIRNFALKAEDDIQIQLGNIFASDELRQTLREAAKNATDLLKILTRLKESCLSEREIASAALSILMTKFEYYFLKPIALVSLNREAAMPFFEYLYSYEGYLLKPIPPFNDEAGQEAMESFFRKLCSLQAVLQRKSNSGAAIRKFALKAEDDIEIQLHKFLIAKDTEHEEEATQELYQTFQVAAKIAAEIIDKEEQHERKREMTCIALTSLRATIDEIINKDFLEKLSSLQLFLREESIAGGATTKYLKTKIIDFALKAEETKSQDNASREPYQTLHDATELLKIITRENEYHESARKMASDALDIFMKNLSMHPIPMICNDISISFFEKLSSLQDLLQKESGGGAAIRYLVLKVQDDIQTQTIDAFLAEDDTEYQEKASQLNQTLQDAAEKAEELLMIINSKKECDDEIEMACVALSSLIGAIEKDFLDDEAARESFLENISSLQDFLQNESTGGAAVEGLETKIKEFALKAGDDIKIKLNNSLRAKDRVSRKSFPGTPSNHARGSGKRSRVVEAKQ